MNPKQFNDGLQIASYVQLVHFKFRPWLTDILIEIFIGCIDELVVIQIWEK